MEGAAAPCSASSGLALGGSAADSGSMRGNFDGGSEKDVEGFEIEASGSGNARVISVIILFGPEVASIACSRATA